MKRKVKTADRARNEFFIFSFSDKETDQRLEVTATESIPPELAATFQSIIPRHGSKHRRTLHRQEANTYPISLSRRIGL